jgi:AmpD protein
VPAHNACVLHIPANSGRLSGAQWVPSPNYDERPEGAQAQLIVIHCISLPPGHFGGGEVAALFCNRLDPQAHPYFADLESLRVSAHFLIDRRGELTQFVDCGHRAWHAGQSSYCGRQRCNDFSIGIELEGTEHMPYENAQYLTLVALIAALRLRYPTLAQAPVVGHSDIAPGRKSDPGRSFDWARLRGELRSVSLPILAKAVSP